MADIVGDRFLFSFEDSEALSEVQNFVSEYHVERYNTSFLNIASNDILLLYWIKLSQFSPKEQYVFEYNFDDMPISYSLDIQYVFHLRGASGFARLSKGVVFLVSSLHLQQRKPQGGIL